MIAQPARSTRRSNSTQVWSKLAMLIALAAAAFSMSCGGGSSTPKFSGNTLVTVLISSTANDDLDEFDLGIQSLTLTSQSGKTVSLVSSAEPAEFIHVNGLIEPLVTVSIPQDVYTSATVTIASAGFTCITLTPQGGIDTTSFAGQPPSGGVSLNLPTPITVTGDSMGLFLNLQEALSASYSSCYFGNQVVTYAITPTFNSTAASLSSQPTNSANGKAFGINGQVSSIDSANNSFVVTYPGPEELRTLTVFSGANTAYQGINSFPALAVGSLVNLDGGVQSDGSIMATRVAVEDLTATSVMTGPLLFVSDAEPALMMWPRQEQGALFANGLVGGAEFLSFANANFQISGQLANLNSLPFIPSFNAANMVAGQNVYVSTTATSFQGGFPYVPASTATLLPQTIDGTVSVTSSTGNFTIYSVNLASYDLFPALAVQAGQTTLLNNPSQVEVYVDGSTQMLNSQPLAAGNLLRFYGLVFNDNGTLRMDCAQVSDGASETQQSNSAMAVRSLQGQVKEARSVSFGPMHETSRLITPAQ